MPRSAPPLELPRVGRYRIVDRIAVGGMAEIFRATEERSVGAPRTVIVKRMLPHVASSPGAAAMFAQEARLASHIGHPNVVRAIESGDEGGSPYLVLEYIRGCDLWRLTRHLTREGTVLSTELALFIATELLAGLDAVHGARDESGNELGIVHLDVSPSNVLLSIHGDVKLSDFGIARTHPEPTTPLAKKAKGKIGYLAPELVAGGTADHRADVFSAAVIAAELLTGKPLFAGGSELAILLAIRDGRFDSLEAIASSLPPGVADALLEALAPDPVRRTIDARTLRRRLREPLENIAPLRHELASIVSSIEASSPDEVLDVTAEVELDLPATPLSPETESTGHPPPSLFVVTTASGFPMGAFTFAQVVEAIATGLVAASDLVSRGDDSPRPVYASADLARHLPPSSLTPITKEAPTATPPLHRVDIADAGFVRALARTAIDRETGLWLCERGAVRKEVYVEAGVPAFVTSNVAGELLGESLVANGVLSRGELDMALAVMPRYEGKLGDTLVGLGLVEPVHLFQQIAAQVKEKLLDVFMWSTGVATFYRGVPPPQSGFPLALDAWSILDEGLRRRTAQDLDRDVFATHLADSLVRTTPPPFGARAALSPLLSKALDLASTPIGLQELVAKLEEPSGRNAGRGYRAVSLLLRLDAIRWIA